MTASHLAVEALLVRAIETADSLDDALRATISGLADSADHYHGVGVYLLEGDTLVLHDQVGPPTPHTRIPVSQGLCGAAVRERQTIVVGDVRADPRYLACSRETCSEIVVPIAEPDGRIVGEIDIDSEVVKKSPSTDPPGIVCFAPSAGFAGATVLRGGSEGVFRHPFRLNSDEPAAFGPEDRARVETTAAALGARFALARD